MIVRPVNWYVITGAPCSGKTSVINELERLGYRVVHEAARAYIDSELQKGKTLEDIKSDALSFERHLLFQKIETSSQLPPKERIFLDRGIPDSIAYYLFHHIDIEEAVFHSRRFRYRKIFFMNRLQFEEDPVRDESEEIAAILDRLLEDSYRLFNYEVIRVPSFSVKERAWYILERL